MRSSVRRIPRARSVRARAGVRGRDRRVARRCARRPDNDTLLALYSLYKQASAGDCRGERPGALDMVDRAKYDAWAKRKGMARDDAMREYVELVEGLKRREAAWVNGRSMLIDFFLHLKPRSCRSRRASS